MNPRHRALTFALGAGSLSTEELDAEPIDMVVDPDHPETIQCLSLIEYAQLKDQVDIEVEDTREVSTEGFSEGWQNFKNRFERQMRNEDAYIDTMTKRLKELKNVIQAATGTEVSNVPIGIFANCKWFQLGGKVLQNAQQVLQELDRLQAINNVVEAEWQPQFDKAVKAMIDILALGATDVASAHPKAYTIDAAFPTPKLAALAKRPISIKLRSGKSITGHVTDPYMGSWLMGHYEVDDSRGISLKRGEDFYTEDVKPTKIITKVQLKPATKDEMKKMVEVCIGILDVMDKYVVAMQASPTRMLVDKLNNFENHHRNWRTYPTEERENIAGILNAADHLFTRNWVAHDVCDNSRMAIRAVERFIEMSVQRMK